MSLDMIRCIKVTVAINLMRSVFLILIKQQKKKRKVFTVC